jgi:uncharacterized protein (DUF2249 family)
MNRTLLFDVSRRPPRESQRRLLEVFDRAMIGDTIKLVSDTAVAPVCQLLFEEREGQFLCHMHKEAPREWVARIIKTR